MSDDFRELKAAVLNYAGNRSSENWKAVVRAIDAVHTAALPPSTSSMWTNREHAMRLDDEADRQSHIFGSGSNLLAVSLRAGAAALRTLDSQPCWKCGKHNTKTPTGECVNCSVGDDLQLCGYAIDGPPAICTCGNCNVDQAEMETANKDLEQWRK